MLHIHIITLGKLKETYWREAEAEYIKRLQLFIKLDIHEIKEEPFSEKNPPELIKAREAEKLKTTLEKFTDAYIIVLDEGGQEKDSVEFSTLVEEVKMTASELVFIIGGPLGLDPSVKKLARTIISLSRLTFTHQMIRIILLEQLYRSQMIASGRRYHY